MVVIALIALTLGLFPASHLHLALIPIGVGVPAMFLRSRGEFLAVIAILTVLVIMLVPALVSTHSPE
jgi:hypothetical protein